MFLGGNLVTWRSEMKIVVARSSAEAEYRAMAQRVSQLLWMKIVWDDLKPFVWRFRLEKQFDYCAMKI